MKANLDKIIVACLFSFLMPELLVGQVITQKETSFINSDAVTSFDGDEVLNPHEQANYTSTNYSIPGEFNLHYYGSGDVDDDGDIDFTDHSTILSNISDRTDINGDGVTNNTDKTILYNYLTDQIPVLPAHWNFLNSTEKTNWFQNMLAIDLTDQHPYIPGVWECGQYTMQTQINFTGIENIANSGINFSTYDTTMNNRFNIPIYRVNTKTSSNVAHAIITVDVSTPANVFTNYIFIEPQNDQIVTPGSQSLNQFANLNRYCRTFDSGLNQYVYGAYPVINFNIIGTPTVSWQHPDLVVNKPAKWGYIHPGGANPPDITINPEDSTNPSFTGQPNPASWASTFYSDIDNRTGGVYDSTYWNYDIQRAWKAVSDSSTLIDTTYSSHDTVNFPGLDPQVISVRDVTNPYFTYVPSAPILFTEWQANGVPSSQGGDNCGYYTITRNFVSNTRGIDPDSCNYYTFTETYTDHNEDPTGNFTDTTFTVPIELNPIQFTYVPPSWVINYWEDYTNPANTGGYATAINPAGTPVNISIADSSLQNPDPTLCEHYNFPYYRYHWASNDLIGPCQADSIYALQYIEVQENLAPSWTEFPESPIYVPYGESIHPDNTGYPDGEDTISGMPVTNYWYDSITNQTTTEVYIDRHWHLEDICSTPTNDSIQEIIQEIMPAIPTPVKKEEFLIYPNPTNGLVNLVDESEKSGKTKVKMFDLTGRELEEMVLESNPGENKTTLDVSGYPAGTYIIRFISSEQNITMKLLIR